MNIILSRILRYLLLSLDNYVIFSYVNVCLFNSPICSLQPLSCRHSVCGMGVQICCGENCIQLYSLLYLKNLQLTTVLWVFIHLFGTFALLSLKIYPIFIFIQAYLYLSSLFWLLYYHMYFYGPFWHLDFMSINIDFIYSLYSCNTSWFFHYTCSVQ